MSINTVLTIKKDDKIVYQESIPNEIGSRKCLSKLGIIYEEYFDDKKICLTTLFDCLLEETSNFISRRRETAKELDEYDPFDLNEIINDVRNRTDGVDPFTLAYFKSNNMAIHVLAIGAKIGKYSRNPEIYQAYLSVN